MFEESVILKNDFLVSSTVLSNNQEKINPIHWMFVRFVELFQVLPDFKLGNNFEFGSVMLPK